MDQNSIAQEIVEVKPELPAARRCCICGDPFAPEDETQVLCLGCERLGYACGCVMPWQSCPVCEATEALRYGKPTLDLNWRGYPAGEVCNG